MDKRNYLTLCDGAYAHYAHALFMSIKQHVSQFHLYVLCVDEAARDKLSPWQGEHLTLLLLSDHETADLLAVKATRTRGEYCWTLTPFSFDFVFNTYPDVETLTYLDADLCFLGPDTAIRQEFIQSKKGALITLHAYAPDYDQSATSGKFCVQYVIFHRSQGRTILQDWQQKCLEWCFNRVENGRFGDQKYLDEWPIRFPDDVHVLTALNSILAPWNAIRFPYSEAVIWHFHGLRLVEIDGRAQVQMDSSYKLPDVTIKHVYEPYVAHLANSYAAINRPDVTP